MSGGFKNKGPLGSNQLTTNEVLWVQTGQAGVVLLTETTAPSSTAGVGKIYVKTSDSLLYYLNSSGVEVQIGTGSATGYQAPLSGAVDGSNRSYTFSIAPNVIVADNSIIRKTASDGTVNWSGTTSIVLNIEAPTRDLFAVA